MFTPSTKATTGHDLNISLDAAAAIVGAERLAEAGRLCLDLFTRAVAKLASTGLVLADTKFELGFVDGRLVVCDEVLTPDSSRIWPADEVRPGETPPSFDKQPFRDWLATQPWDRTPPPPKVPDEIIAITSSRYIEAYERVTGRSLDDWYGS
jgi:phosphoribosylaminoimidazole-succinocarboxamide synthase